jgi:hypothetical protein
MLAFPTSRTPDNSIEIIASPLVPPYPLPLYVRIAKTAYFHGVARHAMCSVTYKRLDESAVVLGNTTPPLRGAGGRFACTSQDFLMLRCVEELTT